ncbi:hypothetical protein ACGF7W_35215 [Streptomyces sp. NPDC048219]|uniref:hypothetical protein n=1 Tax=unclassified Streptomyces TaxID=2593676 RepID=UPI00342A68D0
MSTTIPTPVPAAPSTKHDDELGEAPLSRGAAIFVIVVALLGTVLSTIDVLVNGWWPAVAHLAWVFGVFLLISLVLGTVLGLVLGTRQADRGETPAVPSP